VSGEALDMTDWTIAAFTHRGRVRAANEDAIAVGADVLTGDMDTPVTISTSGDRCLLMVADGIGGHAQGARASRAVLDYLVATADRISSPESCADAIEEANQRLYVLMRQRQEAFGMGTTLAGVIILPTAMLTFNVGDSRCYLFSNRRLIQLSHDDVEDGMKTRSGERRSHVITQALGGHSFLSVDPHINVDAPLGPKEALVLCTDGLTDMVSDDSIALTLNVTDSPAQTVRILAGKAFASGGRDNVSLVVARCSGSRSA
jgi:serine/threonine protein phosphatase PrpC